MLMSQRTSVSAFGIRESDDSVIIELSVKGPIGPDRDTLIS